MNENFDEIPPRDSDFQVVVRNSIVAGNRSDSGPDIAGLLTSEGYNLLQNVDTRKLFFHDPDHKHATDKTVTDLSFISNQLQNANGPDGKLAFSQTLALLNISGNPAIDAVPSGDECTITIPVLDFGDHPVTDSTTNMPLTFVTDHDQRGVARPSGQGCDIGAYEYSGG